HLRPGALADGDQQDHRADADQDAQGGQRRAQLVGLQTGEGEAEDLAESHRALPCLTLCCSEIQPRSPLRSSETISPSISRIARSACSAMSCSWVIRTMVRPALCSRSNSAIT